MSKRILIVEDDRDIRGLLEDLLGDEGYEVSALDYTESILQSISRFNPDLVILDFLLPGINGGELCYQIKSNPFTMHLPVVMMSAFPRVLESLGDYGANAFIEKPFDIQSLLRVVQNCFSNDLAVV
jgi:DNA-binding response OmpR family regulator